MKCKKCGTQIIPGNRFCMKCGSSVSTQANTQPSAKMKESLKCKKCGAEITAGNKYCRSCGAVAPKASKPVYKKWWFWALAGFVAIGIIGGSGAESDHADTAAQSPTATISISVEPAATPAPAATSKPVATPMATADPTATPTQNQVKTSTPTPKPTPDQTKAPEPTKALASAETPVPTVAPTEKPQATKVPSSSAENGRYIGNINNGKLHNSDCPNLPKEENRRYFNTREEAVAAGYDDPCGNCHP